jgi:hypothetical protein
MHPTEFWWLFDQRKPVKMYGRMTEAEVEEIYNKAYGDEDF